VLAGLVLAEVEPDDPSLADALLVCATEVTTADEIEVFAWALRDEIEQGRQLSLPGLADSRGGRAESGGRAETAGGHARHAIGDAR
jgi:hypothetical protein